jgi:hypothetical protein
LTWIHDALQAVARHLGFGNHSLLATWTQQNRLTVPLDPRCTQFIQRDDRVSLERLAALCHDVVDDRESSFTLDKRVRLYERWLASGQPCLMAMTDGNGELLGASVVLPLTYEAYQQFCFHGLDALDIETYHIVSRATHTTSRYLLVDMLAKHDDAMGRLPTWQRNKLRGLGFRGAIFHLSAMFDPDAEPPIIICSSENRGLGRLLKAAKFDDTCIQAGRFTIYKADLRSMDSFPRDVQKYLGLVLKLARYYKTQRQLAGRSSS